MPKNELLARTHQKTLAIALMMTREREMDKYKKMFELYGSEELKFTIFDEEGPLDEEGVWVHVHFGELGELGVDNSRVVGSFFIYLKDMRHILSCHRNNVMMDCSFLDRVVVKPVEVVEEEPAYKRSRLN